MKKLLVLLLALSLFSCAKMEIKPSIKQVVITVDDAPQFPSNTFQMMSVLSGYKATFFAQGYYLEIFPELGHRIAKDFTLANHTYSHPNLEDRPDLLINEVFSTQKMVDSINLSVGKPLNNFFRFPYGACNTFQVDYLLEQGEYIVYWDLDASDWSKDVSLEDIKDYYRQNLDNFQGTPIILFHLSDNSIEGMRWLLGELKSRNIEVISLEEYLFK